MPGFRYRFNVPDDQPGDPKILLHRILLLAGLLLLGFGSWAGWRYFHLKPPADADLHELPLQKVLSFTEVRDPHATNNIRALELHSADHRVVRYNEFWPCFDRVCHRDTNLTLLVNATNQVWLVKDSSGHEFGRDSFRKRNLQVKMVSAMVAILFIPLGALMFFPAVILEYCLHRDGKLPKDGTPVSARKFTLFAGLVGYLYFFGFVISPWLCKILPGMVVALIWVLSAGALGNLILRHFKQKPRKPVDTTDASRPDGPTDPGV
ncbi:MAG: hypothetical protein ABSD57_13110 [Verrucomicrobiota bacterium]